MKFEYIISKETCFFYWLQSITEWSVYGPERDIYEYYKRQTGKLSQDQIRAVSEIKAILLSDKQPRLTLASLYSNSVDKSVIARKVADAAYYLLPSFECVWPQISEQLSEQANRLQAIDLAWMEGAVRSIAAFLGSSLDTQTQKVYLIQNTADHSSVGHQIEGTDFILLHPSTKGAHESKLTDISTVVHELIHLIEFKSGITTELMKESYDRLVSGSGKTPPEGMTWRMLYVEIIVYCFANNITGGYLSPHTFQKPRPTIEQMRGGYAKREANNSLKTSDRIAWAALNIQSEVERYIAEGKVVDSAVADMISIQILKQF